MTAQQILHRMCIQSKARDGCQLCSLSRCATTDALLWTFHSKQSLHIPPSGTDNQSKPLRYSCRSRTRYPRPPPLGTYSSAANRGRVGLKLLPSFGESQAPAAPHLPGCQGHQFRPGNVYCPAFLKLGLCSSGTAVKAGLEATATLVTVETRNLISIFA